MLYVEMSNHSPTSFTAESNLSTRQQKPTERIPAWAWVALIGAGLVLVVLGLVQEFTTVTCGPVGESNGLPIVPMCISFVGYDWLADIVGLCLVFVGGSKLIRVALNRK